MSHAAAFALDPEVVHLNHGSFGACPRAVLAAQTAIRAELEAATMRYFVCRYPDAVTAARQRVAAFLGADPDGLAFVPNATTGVATALADLRLDPGDELVTTDHAYRACRNQLDALAARAGARVVVAPIPLPVTDLAAPATAVLDRVGPRTRAVLVDHVTSPTALVFDVAAIARAVPPTVALIVDGAHAPGHIELAVAELGATYYAGNLHKWTCAPKGAGFLWVAPHRRPHLRPLVVSHGATLPTAGTTRFRLEHDWTGTHDPSPYLTAPTAIAAVAELGGDWPAVRAHNRRLAHRLAEDLARALGADRIAPPTAHAAMVPLAVTLPSGATALAIERALLERGLELPVIDHPASPGPLVRVSAHLYNHPADAERALAHLRAVGVTGRRLS